MSLLASLSTPTPDEAGALYAPLRVHLYGGAPCALRRAGGRHGCAARHSFLGGLLAHGFSSAWPLIFGDPAVYRSSPFIWERSCRNIQRTANWDSNAVLVHPAKFYAGIQAFAYAEIGFSIRIFPNRQPVGPLVAGNHGR